MMSNFTLTKPEASYLSEVYRIIEEGREPAVTLLASRFGVKLPTVIDVLEKLERKGLLVRERWRAPKLTRTGIRVASSILHRHRIIELYFSRKLGLAQQLACREAAKIDYILDDIVVARMCRELNHPDKCFHMKPINHTHCKR